MKRTKDKKRYIIGPVFLDCYDDLTRKKSQKEKDRDDSEADVKDQV
jgi:hypothetical protein